MYRLRAGRSALRASTTDAWGVTGKRAGQTLRPDQVTGTERVLGGGSVAGLVRWQRAAERKQPALPASVAPAPVAHRSRQWQRE